MMGWFVIGGIGFFGVNVLIDLWQGVCVVGVVWNVLEDVDVVGEFVCVDFLFFVDCCGFVVRIGVDYVLYMVVIVMIEGCEVDFDVVYEFNV